MARKVSKKSKASEEDQPPVGPFDMFVGWDNGSTGALTILDTQNGKGHLILHTLTPTKTVKNYQRSVDREITRVDVHQLRKIFSTLAPHRVLFWLEKPMVMPARFQASLSAVRALEAQLIALENAQADGVQVSLQYVNSLDWQKVFIPQALAAKAESKMAEKKRKKLLALCKKKGKTPEETKKILAFATKKLDYARTAKTNILGEAANEVARKLYPEIQTEDADSVLIAELARRRHAIQPG